MSEKKLVLSFGKKKETLEKKDENGDTVVKSEVEEPVEAGVHDADTPWANVNVHLDARINVGNYSSVAVGVSLTLPCPVDQTDQTFQKCRTWCEERMGEMTADIKGSS